MLNWMVFVDDPIYLTEPFVRTTDFVENKRQVIAPYPCYPVVEIDRPVGVVPSNLFGQNPSLEEFSTKYSIPFDATRGGAETMYPEFDGQDEDHGAGQAEGGQVTWRNEEKTRVTSMKSEGFGSSRALRAALVAVTAGAVAVVGLARMQAQALRPTS